MANEQPSRSWPILRNLGLLGTIAALGALNWQILTAPIDIRPIALDRAAPSNLVNGGAIAGTTRRSREHGNYTETLARPMFRADRKPFVAAPEAPPVVEETVEVPPAAPSIAPGIEPPQGLKLLGVMRDGDGQDRALVKSAVTPAASWLRIGDEIDGWRLAAIASSAVTLSADASSIQLELYPVAASRPKASEP